MMKDLKNIKKKCVIKQNDHTYDDFKSKHDMVINHNVLVRSKTNFRIIIEDPEETA